MQNLCNYRDLPYNNEHNSFILHIITIDIESGACLKCAHYQLNTYSGDNLHTTSDSCGNAKFINLLSGNYTFVQSVPPPGYQPHPYCWKVRVDDWGFVWIDGIEKNRFNVYNSSDDSEKRCSCLQRAHHLDL